MDSQLTSQQVQGPLAISHAASIELNEGAPVLDARGFAVPRGSPAGCTEYLWAVSAFHCREGAHVHVAATCFDATLWVADFPLQDLVVHLQADLGLVLPQKQLLQVLDEALSSGARWAAATQSQPPRHSLQATAQNAAATKAAVELEVPSQNGDLGAAGGSGGSCPPPASMSVLLPPSHFGGGEVVVRLPVHGNMRRLEGPEAQRQCLSLVSCLHRQLEDLQGELRGARSELGQLRAERVLLLKELERSSMGGEAAGGAQTLRSQYGLAGAPPPPPAAAAKRMRTAPAAALGHLLGEGGLAGGAAGRSGSGLLGGLGSQSQQPQQQQLPPLAQRAPGGLYAVAGSGAGAPADVTTGAGARVNWGLWSEPQSESQGPSQPQAPPQGATQPLAAPGAAAGTVAATGIGATRESSPALLANGAHVGADAEAVGAAATTSQDGLSSGDAAPGPAAQQAAAQQDAAAAPPARDPSRVAVNIRPGGGPPGRGRGGIRGAWPRR
ncbi:hypothetical protein HYH02_006153 [Chlamydomonas schloesseri]|uniref:Uncharacterized protein n=1 Tax=Chlamydomonas schloesseri TaxID=2026947 RepID=A0A835WJZ9_9CHLO|nr:hypothetical protein HYH02_006153 [Chlamydomonas schloesseri]|eukprot:KAG2448802.1 hypothetical protein HYH02_006153 [Chlamydomonas schloesseri]